MATHICRFEPWGIDVEVEHLDTVLSAACKGGVPLEAECGGRRACGTCAVEVVRGNLEEPHDEERAIIQGRSFRLGCRARIMGDVVVRPLVGRAARNPKPISDARDESQKESTSRMSQGGYLGIDVGTTNIKIALWPEVGAEVRSSVANSQKIWGADVLSRLSAAIGNQDVAAKMSQSVSRDIAEAFVELCDRVRKQSGKSVSVQRTVIAGNTIMTALLCGGNLEAYARPPYGQSERLELSSGPLFEKLMLNNETMEIIVLDSLGGLVGGDVTAGLYDIDAYRNLNTPVLYIDIGTNIETVLATSDTLFVGSAPAGSTFSFEGAQGSLALEDVLYLLRQDALMPSGLLDEVHPLVKRDEEGILSAKALHGTVSQKDIRAIQLAKAAMSVSVAEVIRASGCDLSAVGRVVFGGAFSARLFDIVEALSLIPRDLFHYAEIEFRPDCALEGALKIAMREPAGDVVTKNVIPVNFVEDSGFAQRFMEHLNF